jgi:hypothetical protein
MTKDKLTMQDKHHSKEQLETFESPAELMVKNVVYKKAMEIDKAMTIYIKPKAWWIPNFLYKAIIKDHVLLVDKVAKE